MDAIQAFTGSNSMKAQVQRVYNALKQLGENNGSASVFWCSN